MTRPREHVPRSAPELEMLSGFLDWLRDSVVAKLDGLSDADLRRSLVSSKTTLLGLVKHLAYVERWWFQHWFAAHDVELPKGDLDFEIAPDDTVESVVDVYRRECDKSREIVAGASPEDHIKREGRSDHTLRWIMIHMIEETARHAGHADILREQIDGSTGE